VDFIKPPLYFAMEDAFFCYNPQHDADKTPVGGFMEVNPLSPQGREEIYRVEGIPISSEPKFIGKTLKASGLLEKEGVTVGALRKGDKYLFNPPDTVTFDAGDALILIGETNEIREIKKLAG
jgi:uncharacterized protein with PhoU and TrkA domain